MEFGALLYFLYKRYDYSRFQNSQSLDNNNDNNDDDANDFQDQVLEPPVKRPTKPKRNRPTFSKMLRAGQVSELVNIWKSVWRGEQPTWRLVYSDNEAVNAEEPDYTKCWYVWSKKDDRRKEDGTIMASPGYRFSVLWAAHSADSPLDLQQKDILKQKVLEVDRSNKVQHAHMCGRETCVNFKHIQMKSQRENEVDKHYLYFANHPDADIRQRFRLSFSRELEALGYIL